MRNSRFKKYGQEIQRFLEREDLLIIPGKYEADPEEGRIWYSHSYPIKAFEKFLGYYDKDERIAYNPSISFNTDFSFCLSACVYSKNPGQDKVILDDETSETYTKKAEFALSKFKKDYSISGSFGFYIKRYRRYEKSKGMSESSAVASAVSKSLISCAFNGEADKDLALQSRYARYVSGSGTRAVFDGISMWLSYPGMRKDDCFALKIKDRPEEIKYGIFPKNNQSPTDSAHVKAIESPFYDSWVNEKYKFIRKNMKKSFDLDDLLQRSTVDMLSLNSVLLSSGLMIQTPESLRILEKAIKFKEKHDGFYFTADTGPSIMILTKDEKLIDEFSEGIGDNFLPGGFNFKQHLDYVEKFKREASQALAVK
ncbi:mevalonate pyrophosphate decarboxylase [Cuniculiplasma sp. SKW3]|uniref:mevalonate 3,5-bisphosphate decarboxylase n=1 Tax=Cuniculiplasma sp. SKW3 TaxID=3400170 RepID=UPI003FD670C5